MVIDRPKNQVYSEYTKQDFEVWKILFDRQMQILEPNVSIEYINSIKKVGFSSNKIPDFNDVNKVLNSITSWSIVVVPNISPQKDFFLFLSQKKFTCTCWLRSINQLDYLEEPDMFHDVFGHVPLLCNSAYVNFFKGIGDIALKYIDNPKAIELLGRIYWFTIEFGLIREKGEIKIYGAGIISSKGETLNSLSDSKRHLNFSIETILKTDYRTDIFQEVYFVIDSFQELYNSLDNIENILLKFLK